MDWKRIVINQVINQGSRAHLAPRPLQAVGEQVSLVDGLEEDDEGAVEW